MCRRAGLGEVVVLERGRLAGGVSGSAAGGLSPGTHTLTKPAPFLELARHSLALHRELDAARREPILRSIDWLLVTHRPPEADLAGRAQAAALDASSARELEPELGDAGGALLIQDQSHADPLGLAAALAVDAGTVITRVEVSELVVTGERIDRVDTSHGSVRPRAVVIATGSPGARIPGLPPISLRESWVKGHLVATEPAPFRLRTAVAGNGILLLQLADGRIVAGGTEDVGDESQDVREPVVARIRDDMARLVPATSRLELSHAWCCMRPGSPDELPVVDRILENAWITAGHLRTGLLMSAATGEAIADWIGHGSCPPLLAAFGLSRLG